MRHLNEKELRLCPRCGHLMDLAFCPDCGVDTLRTISVRAARQRYKRRGKRELLQKANRPIPEGKQRCWCCGRYFDAGPPDPKVRAEARIARLTPEERQQNFTVPGGIPVDISMEAAILWDEYRREEARQSGLCPDCLCGHMEPESPCPHRDKS